MQTNFIWQECGTTNDKLRNDFEKDNLLLSLSKTGKVLKIKKGNTNNKPFVFDKQMIRKMFSYWIYKRVLLKPSRHLCDGIKRHKILQHFIEL